MTIREIFGVAARPDVPEERWQTIVDHSWHNYGVGQLVLGLFAEICMEMINIPNRIIYTGDVDDYLVALGTFLIAPGGVLLVRTPSSCSSSPGRTERVRGAVQQKTSGDWSPGGLLQGVWSDLSGSCKRARLRSRALLGTI